MNTWGIVRPRGKPRLVFADAGLAVVVIGIVALMVVPLPTFLLDILLATNLAVSVAILLVTLYVGSALELTTFPTLLLITTLVRVALNVSSTRLILLHANAGEVIRAFGSFVVSGNFVVGAVVFLIITIIQFVVVAKGSERVAEVSARFNLDALPGKQMAIDAELRAGSLDRDAAQARRRRLEQESQFYGAMDGASKFVKGDVIATLLIAIVNLVGGVAIGVGQHGLDLTTALRRYGLLTIGDGLVTQIPALLLATAAGILVTRVPGDGGDTALGTELSGQILRVPRAVGAAGIVVALLSLVPGLPMAPLLASGVALFVASRFGGGSRTAHAVGGASDGGAPSFAPSFVPELVAWSLDVSADLAALLREDLPALPERLRQHVFRELGVPLPPCRVGVDATLPDGNAVLSIREVPARIVEVTGSSASEIAASIEQRALELLLDRAPDFIGIGETRALLDRLEAIDPNTVRQVIPKTIDVSALSEVLRLLVAEGISVRDLRGILEAIARAPAGDAEPGALAEYVRTELRRALTWDLTAGAGEIDVILVDPSIEDAIRGAVTRTSAGSFVALAPRAADEIVEAVTRALTSAEFTPGKPHVVLTRPDVRRFLRQLLQSALPHVHVIASTELLPEVRVNQRSRATLILSAHTAD